MMGSVNGGNTGNYMSPPAGDKSMGMGGPRQPMMNPSLGGGYQGGPGGGPGMNGPGPASRFMGGPVRPPMSKPGYVQPVPVSTF